MKKNIGLLGLLTIIFASTTFLVPFTTYAQNYDMNKVYKWAYEMGITTQPTLEQARMDQEITRQATAKMMVIFAEKVLNLKPDTSIECNFLDDDITPDLIDYVKKSCQLGLMGQSTEYFRPMEYITRAQFGAMLSRALWGDTYEGADPYYISHLTALQEVGIMEDISDPTNHQEIRGDIMHMLMLAQGNSKESGVDEDVSFDWENGVYKGEYKNGVRDGIGRYTLGKDLSVYEGEWKNDLPNGNGVYSHGEGSIKGLYSGEWKNGYMEGNGILIEVDEESVFKYVGEFKGNYLDGKGKVIVTMFTGDNIPQEYIYEGNRKEGKRNGFGKIISNGSVVYEGNFTDDEPDYDNNSEITDKQDNLKNQELEDSILDMQKSLEQYPEGNRERKILENEINYGEKIKTIKEKMMIDSDTLNKTDTLKEMISAYEDMKKLNNEYIQTMEESFKEGGIDLDDVTPFSLGEKVQKVKLFVKEMNDTADSLIDIMNFFIGLEKQGIELENLLNNPSIPDQIKEEISLKMEEMLGQIMNFSIQNEEYKKYLNEFKEHNATTGTIV